MSTAGSSPIRRSGLIGIVLLTVTVILAGCTSKVTTSATGTPATVSEQSTTSTAAIATPTTGTSGPAITGVPTTVAGTPRSTRKSPSVTTATVTKTKPGQTITVGPPKSTPEPAAAAGDCPYLSADIVSFITGQHHGQTQLVRLKPQSMCVFYRADGGWMGSVRVIQAASPQAAVAAVNQHVPIAGSQPASQPAGWAGGSMATPGQMTQDSSAKSVYAVSKGNIAVVAEENESPSIKARVMAVCAIYGLKLEAGTPPEACSGSEG